MSLTRTPPKQKNNQSAITDMSDTDKSKKPPNLGEEDTQNIGGGAVRKLNSNTDAGEAAATSLLTLEERIAWQMDEALGKLAESMAKMQFKFQEQMHEENGAWKREVENIINNKFQTAKNTHHKEAATHTSTVTHPTTVRAMEPATNTSTPAEDRTQLPLLQLTPPMRKPSIPTERRQYEHAHRYPDEPNSGEEEYHTTRAIPQNRDWLRPQVRMSHSQNIQLDRWGIAFEGDDDKVPVEEFMFRIEHLQQQHDVPWSAIMGDFHKVLKGKAQDWFWMHMRSKGTQSWHEFKADMIKQFKTHRTDFDIMKMLVERKQRYNEDIDDFIHSMRKLQARLSTPMDERELVNIVKGNMIEEVAKILYPMDIRTLPELNKEYHKVQRIFVKRRNFQAPPNHYVRPSRPAVNEIATQNIDPNMEEEPEMLEESEMVDEIRRQPLKCWNCLEIGHTYMDCSKARTIFCYKCGRPQTITPKCPKCNPGNRPRSANEASSSSSSQLQQQQN